MKSACEISQVRLSSKDRCIRNSIVEKLFGIMRKLSKFGESEDCRDARDAVHGRDGYDFDGCRIRVELTRGVGPRGPGGRPLYGPDPRSPRRGPPPRRSGYRVVVSGLPDTGSWQDLKVRLSYLVISNKMCTLSVTFSKRCFSKMFSIRLTKSFRTICEMLVKYVMQMFSETAPVLSNIQIMRI